MNFDYRNYEAAGAGGGSFQTSEKGFFARIYFGSLSGVMYRTVYMICLMSALLCGAACAGSFFPFYENLQAEEGAFFAVRPFYSKTVVPEGEIRDVLWPLYSRKSFKNEETSRALFFWFTHNFNADSQTPRVRNWLLPFYFQGRDANGEDYFALFPLGGTVHEILGRDQIAFALFPLFGKSQINEVKTTSVLWPVYSRTRGDGIRRDRVFPIIGKSVLDDQYEKKFFCWPFWNSAEYFYPGDSGTSWILFPICGRSQMDRERTWWVIPPFFRFTDGARQDRMFCPWPFVQTLKSDVRDKLWIWPLWGRDRRPDGTRSFAVWPLLWSERSEDHSRVKTRKMALPFFYREREVLQEGAAPAEVSSSWRVWPLMSCQREGAASRLRMLELWPVKNSGPVERNWSPLWTLYQRTRDAGAVQTDLLWFAWHSEKNLEADRSEWSLLKGLLAYKRDGDAKRLRFFWMQRGDE